MTRLPVAQRHAHLLRRLCAAAALAAPLLTFAGTPFPLPGLYRVDIEGTSTFQAGGLTVQSSQRTEGGSGTVIAEQKVTGVGPVPAQTYAGKGPVTACFKPITEPAKVAEAQLRQMASGCKMSPPEPKIDGDTATFTVLCPGITQDMRVRRLGERSWEWRIATKQHGTAATGVPGATAAAMNPVVAAMEEHLRKNPTGPEADGIRQQLNALRGGTPTSPAGPDNTSVLRYTKIADACT